MRFSISTCSVTECSVAWRTPCTHCNAASTETNTKYFIYISSSSLKLEVARSLLFWVSTFPFATFPPLNQKLSDTDFHNSQKFVVWTIKTKKILIASENTNSLCFGHSSRGMQVDLLRQREIWTKFSGKVQRVRWLLYVNYPHSYKIWTNL